jgi:hypothetical protein
LKKSSAEFGVGIENRAAIEKRERECGFVRVLEAVDKITGIQRGSRNNGKREGKGVW